MKNRYIFVGIARDTREYVPFRCNYDISAYGVDILRHKQKFSACIGPFRTMRAARYMARNPKCETVQSAEYFAKLEN